MGRLHLIELEDEAWLPKVLRDPATGFLEVSHRLLRTHRQVERKVREILKEQGISEIVDLGSGAGGPMLDVVPALEANGVRAGLTLTDLHPNEMALARCNGNRTERIRYCPEPVDATDVGPRFPGVRTMVASFHHLPEDLARGVLHDAQRSRQPIAVFEFFGRNLPGFVALLPLPVLGFALIPFVRPLRLSTLFFTYVVPLVPALIVWDGWVSYLRIYSPGELRTLVDSLPDDPGYCWEIGTLGWLGAPYLIGKPVEPRSAA